MARMIVGCTFKDKDKSFENVFIGLLHSRILDADSRDYVSRDAWASGYLSSIVDTDRLISAVTLPKNKKGEYTLCYDIKAINEIKAAIQVKNFQQENVINHHTVVYEQNLIKKAMESVALIESGEKETSDDKLRRKAMALLCLLKGFWGDLGNDDIGNYPTDDYFVCLMNKHKNLPYVNEWFFASICSKTFMENKRGILVAFSEI